MSPKMAWQRLLELSTVFERCTGACFIVGQSLAEINRSLIGHSRLGTPFGDAMS